MVCLTSQSSPESAQSPVLYPKDCTHPLTASAIWIRLLRFQSRTFGGNSWKLCAHTSSEEQWVVGSIYGFNRTSLKHCWTQVECPPFLDLIQEAILAKSRSPIVHVEPWCTPSRSHHLKFATKVTKLTLSKFSYGSSLAPPAGWNSIPMNGFSSQITGL